MFKVAGIFPKYLAEGLSIAGMTIKRANSSSEAGKLLLALLEEKFNLVFLTEDLVHEIKDEVADINNKKDISIILLPGFGEKTSFAKERLVDLTRRAVGVSIE